jgi:hypothetical protein
MAEAQQAKKGKRVEVIISAVVLTLTLGIITWLILNELNNIWQIRLNSTRLGVLYYNDGPLRNVDLTIVTTTGQRYHARLNHMEGYDWYDIPISKVTGAASRHFNPRVDRIRYLDITWRYDWDGKPDHYRKWQHLF